MGGRDDYWGGNSNRPSYTNRNQNNAHQIALREGIGSLGNNIGYWGNQSGQGHYNENYGGSDFQRASQGGIEEGQNVNRPPLRGNQMGGGRGRGSGRGNLSQIMDNLADAHQFLSEIDHNDGR